MTEGPNVLIPYRFLLMEEPIEMGEDALEISYPGPSEKMERRNTVDTVGIVRNTGNRCLISFHSALTSQSSKRVCEMKRRKLVGFSIH